MHGRYVIGDGLKYTGISGGLQYTFDQLGATAGFKAVMAGMDDVPLDTSDKSLEKQFAKIDKDNSGKISTDEMKAAIKKLYGIELKPALIAAMMAAADTNQDGEVRHQARTASMTCLAG